MSFITWLQRRLNAHGATLAVDGAFGPLTRKALLRFQELEGIRASGTACAASVARLRAGPSASRDPLPGNVRPVWLAELERRSGLHETRNREALVDWLRAGLYLGDPGKLPWCGDALETVFARTLPDEPLPSRPFWAQSWIGFGRGLSGPAVGAVGVIRWDAARGHCGLVTAWDGDAVELLGGNTSDRIAAKRFARKHFLGFRWPLTAPFEEFEAVDALGTPEDTR